MNEPKPCGRSIAMKPKDCTCETCVNACKGNPGWFLPGEIEKVAKYLGISIEELKATKLIVDYYTLDDVGDVLVYAPVKPYVESPGGRASWGYPFQLGRCVFLDDNDRCSIHPVKPHECREAFCEEKGGNLNKAREKIAKVWVDRQNEFDKRLDP